MASPLRDPASAIRRGLKATERIVRDASGADSPILRGAGRMLARAIRKQLSKQAIVVRKSFGGEQVRSERSQPGEAPRSVAGRLRRSIGMKVVSGVLRVGSARFVSRLLEQGVDTTVNVTPSGRAFGKRRRKAGKAKRTLIIAPRPFMAAALAEAQPKMEGAGVSELQRRGGEIGRFL